MPVPFHREREPWSVSRLSLTWRVYMFDARHAPYGPCQPTARSSDRRLEPCFVLVCFVCRWMKPDDLKDHYPVIRASRLRPTLYYQRHGYQDIFP
jgi:hypothetical protein